MKRIIVLLLVPIFLYSYEISFNKKFTKIVVPDLLSTYISITIESKDESYINTNLDKYNTFIKESKNIIKKDGTLSISPKYTYYKSKQEFEGYTGRLGYEIRSDKAKNINVFIDKLIKLRKELKINKNKLDISNISWMISEKLNENSLDLLRMNVIKWVDKYSNDLAKEISKDCVIRKINIDSINSNYPNRTANSVEVASYSSKILKAVAPIKDDKKITINPNFILECK